MYKAANRNKILIILIVLLLLCLSGLVYWYLNIYLCNVSPKGYEFLEKFIVSKECHTREYELRGTIYNVKDNGDSVSFDMNVWGEDYFQEVSLPWGKLLSERSSIIEGDIFSVDLKISTARTKSKIGSLDLESWEVEQLVFGESEVEEFLEKIYPLLLGEINPFSSEYPLLPDNEIEVGELGEVQSRTTFPSSESLYVILAREYLQSEGLGRRILEGHRDVGISDYLLEVEEFRVSKDYKNVEDSGEESSYISSSCMIIDELIELSTEVSDLEKEMLLGKYCGISSIQKDFLSEIDPSKFLYTEEDFISLLRKERISTDHEVSSHLSFTINLLGDLYSASRMYSNGDLTSDVRISKLRSLIVNEVSTTLSYSDLANLAYVYSLIQKKEGHLESGTYLKELKSIFMEDPSYLLRLIDEDVSSSLFILLAYSEDLEIQDLLDSSIQKIYYSNCKEVSGIYALWDGRVYRAGTNVRFLKLLLNSYDK